MAPGPSLVHSRIAVQDHVTIVSVCFRSFVCFLSSYAKSRAKPESLLYHLLFLGGRASLLFAFPRPHPFIKDILWTWKVWRAAAHMVSVPWSAVIFVLSSSSAGAGDANFPRCPPASRVGDAWEAKLRNDQLGMLLLELVQFKDPLNSAVFLCWHVSN